MSVVFYEGERIYFRPVEMADEADIRAWLNDPANWRTLDQGFPLNEIRERKYIEKLYETRENCALVIVVKEGDRPIGVTGLHQITPVHHSAIFGLVIGDREYQSRGFGTETTKLAVRLGFEEFNLNRIELAVFANNERAIRAYERAGFIAEGRFREVYFRGGQYIDVLRYAILRRDWNRSEPADRETRTVEVPGG